MSIIRKEYFDNYPTDNHKLNTLFNSENTVGFKPTDISSQAMNNTS